MADSNSSGSRVPGMQEREPVMGVAVPMLSLGPISTVEVAVPDEAVNSGEYTSEILCF